MIERYSRPQMARIWSEENKADKWLPGEAAPRRARAPAGAAPPPWASNLAAWGVEAPRHSHRLTHAKEQVAVGKISGPVGSHATVPPDLEDKVCGRLGLLVEPISTQIVHRDP